MAEVWPGGPLMLPHEFTHAGVRMWIPPVPSPVLLELLAHNRWSHFYPGQVPDDVGWELEMRLADPTDWVFDVHQFHWVATTLLGRVAGVALRRLPPQSDDDGYNCARTLAARVFYQWPQFSAWCAARAVDPLAVPFHQLMAAAYAWQCELYTSVGKLAELNGELWPLPRVRDELAGLPQALPAGAVDTREPDLPAHLIQAEQDFQLAELADMGLITPGS